MPRNNGIYSPPSGTTAVSQTPISSAAYNNFVTDITADQNNPRPIIAGGTGAATSQAAIDAFFGAPRTIVDERLLFVDPNDPTKRVRLDAGSVTAGQTRVLTMPDADLDLSGLATQAEGDILYRGATAWQRLPKGTAGQKLRQNAALTAPEWESGWETIDIIGASGSVAALGYSSALASFRTISITADVVPVNDGFNIVSELTTDGGSSWVTTGGLYRRAAIYGDGTTVGGFTADTDNLTLNVVDSVSNAHAMAFGIEIRDFNKSNVKSFEYFSRFANSALSKEYFVKGSGRMLIGAATGIRVRASTGDAVFRNVRLMGIRG